VIKIEGQHLSSLSKFSFLLYMLKKYKTTFGEEAGPWFLFRENWSTQGGTLEVR